MVRFHRREWLRLRPMQQDVLFYLAMFRYKTVVFVMKRNEQIKSLMDYFNFIRDQNAAKMIRIFKFRLNLGIIDRSREDLSQIGWPDVISDRPGRAWAHRSPSNRSTFCWWYVQRYSKIFSCDQATLTGSGRPSVCPSVCHTLFTMFPSSHNHGVIDMDESDAHAKSQGQRSNVNVTEIRGHFAPIWDFPTHSSSLNHRWLWSDAHSLKLHWRGALSFIEVTCQI